MTIRPNGVNAWQFTDTVTPGAAQMITGNSTSMQSLLSGTGAVSATAVLEVTNNPDVSGSWLLLATLNPSGTTFAVDNLTAATAYRWIRARCTAITAGASLEVNTSSRS